MFSFSEQYKKLLRLNDKELKRRKAIMDLNFKKNNIDKDHPDFVYDKAFITLIYLPIDFGKPVQVGREVSLQYFIDLVIFYDNISMLCCKS